MYSIAILVHQFLTARLTIPGRNLSSPATTENRRGDWRLSASWGRYCALKPLSVSQHYGVEGFKETSQYHVIEGFKGVSSCAPPPSRVGGGIFFSSFVAEDPFYLLRNILFIFFRSRFASVVSIYSTRLLVRLLFCFFYCFKRFLGTKMALKMYFNFFIFFVKVL